MAQASTRVQVISRGSGKCAVAAAAYRAGEKLRNERDGQSYSYAQKKGILHTEIMLPAYAPERLQDRATLWNEIECRVEKAKNAQLAREIRFSLPQELTQEQNIALARVITQDFVEQGMIADLAIHDKGDGNPHAHMMLTMRSLNPDGTFAAKSKEEHVLDEHGAKIRLKNGRLKSVKVCTNDWNTPENYEEWRRHYQDITNRHLEYYGHPDRIDIRSYEEQGIDQTPTVHLGQYAHQMEQQGRASERGDINRQIEADNRERASVQQDLALVDEAIRQAPYRQQRAVEKAAAEKGAAEKAAAEQRRQEQDRIIKAQEQKQREYQRESKEEQKREMGLLELELLQELEAEEKQQASRRETLKVEQQRQAAARREAYRKEKKFVQPQPPQPPHQPAASKDLFVQAERERAERARQRQEGIEKLKKAAKFPTLQKLAEQQAVERDGIEKLKRAAKTPELRELAEQEEKKSREFWEQLAKEQAAERPNWSKLAEAYNARQVDWAELARHQEAARPEWARQAEQKRQEKEQLQQERMERLNDPWYGLEETEPPTWARRAEPPHPESQRFDPWANFQDTPPPPEQEQRQQPATTTQQGDPWADLQEQQGEPRPATTQQSDPWAERQEPQPPPEPKPPDQRKYVREPRRLLEAEFGQKRRQTDADRAWLEQQKKQEREQHPRQDDPWADVQEKTEHHRPDTKTQGKDKNPYEDLYRDDGESYTR